MVGQKVSDKQVSALQSKKWWKTIGGSTQGPTTGSDGRHETAQCGVSLGPMKRNECRCITRRSGTADATFTYGDNRTVEARCNNCTPKKIDTSVRGGGNAPARILNQGLKWTTLVDVQGCLFWCAITYHMHYFWVETIEKRAITFCCLIGSQRKCFIEPDESRDPGTLSFWTSKYPKAKIVSFMIGSSKCMYRAKGTKLMREIPFLPFLALKGAAMVFPSVLQKYKVGSWFLLCAHNHLFFAVVNHRAQRY